MTSRVRAFESVVMPNTCTVSVSVSCHFSAAFVIPAQRTVGRSRARGRDTNFVAGSQDSLVFPRNIFRTLWTSNGEEEEEMCSRPEMNFRSDRAKEKTRGRTGQRGL